MSRRSPAGETTRHSRQVDTPELVALLWEVCRVPDFRNTLLEARKPTGAGVSAAYQQAARAVVGVDGRGGFSTIIDGDIETLMARIAHIRTWTYIMQRRPGSPTPMSGRPAPARSKTGCPTRSTQSHPPLRRPSYRCPGRSVHCTATASVDDAGGVWQASTWGAGFAFKVAGAGPRRCGHRAARGALGHRGGKLDRLCSASDDFRSTSRTRRVGRAAHRPHRGYRRPAAARHLRAQADLVDSHGRRVHKAVQAWIRQFVPALKVLFDRVDQVHLKPPARAIRYALQQNLESKVARSLSPLDRKNLARMTSGLAPSWSTSTP